MGCHSQNCPECGAAPGELHKPRCDVEQCPECGRQKLSCGCKTHRPRLAWKGVWPGVSECRAFGWFAKLIQGSGWKSCKESEKGATEDIGRLYAEATWNPDLQQFQLPEKHRGRHC